MDNSITWGFSSKLLIFSVTFPLMKSNQKSRLLNRCSLHLLKCRARGAVNSR
jgi:hypothetical protein